MQSWGACRMALDSIVGGIVQPPRETARFHLQKSESECTPPPPRPREWKRDPIDSSNASSPPYSRAASAPASQEVRLQLGQVIVGFVRQQVWLSGGLNYRCGPKTERGGMRTQC